MLTLPLPKIIPITIRFQNFVGKCNFKSPLLQFHFNWKVMPLSHEPTINDKCQIHIFTFSWFLNLSWHYLKIVKHNSKNWARYSLSSEHVTHIKWRKNCLREILVRQSPSLPMCYGPEVGGGTRFEKKEKYCLI